MLPSTIFKTSGLNLSLSLMIALGLSCTALAEEASDTPAQENRVWDVEVDLGVINTSGNTETTSLQAKVDAKQTLEKWENQYIFSTLYKEDQVEQDDGSEITEKTAEKYFGSLKSAYLIGVEKSYLFGYGSHTHDEFGAYRSYSTVALGYGDWLYSTPKVQWFVEAGPGYFEGKKTDELNPDAEIIESGAMVRAASELVWKITGNSEFKQLLSVESGADNTRTISETSVSANITNAMKMKVGFNIANDTNVSPGKEKTDTTTFVNLVYNF
jgi:putative salt-induced outer membrane protein